MHHPTLLSILLALVLTFSGCLGFLDADEEPEPDDGTGGDEDPDQGTPEPDENNTDPSGNETGLYATIERFSSDIMQGTAPANVTFTWEIDTNDEEATWSLDLGDGSSEEGTASDDSDSLIHSYEQEGNYTATFTVNYGDGQSVQSSLNLSIASGTELPEQWTFEYGATLGCLGDIGCISQELGPDGQQIDGYWQELDESYWGLDFTVEVDNVRHDSDCTAYDEDQEPIEADLNGADGPCEDLLPAGTKWLFLYSYAEPALSLELVFSQPE